jgi:catechol 2,3-dioxygenase-like lactoylglutathione lyase family enzyme
MTGPDEHKRPDSHLKPRFLSHGTVECHDLEAARRFYTAFLGLEVRQTSSRSLMLRLNSTTTIACVETRGTTSAGIYSHFGLDFDNRDEVDAAYQRACAEKDAYGVKKITRPVDQHGTYSFYVIDGDDNWWEILTNPPGGYSYVFDIDESAAKWRDQNQGSARRADWEDRTRDA